MAIRYYPNRAVRAKAPAIDRQMAKRTPAISSARLNTTTTAIDAVISANFDWQINSVLFNFSNATARNYSAKVINGRKVITNLNDYLWIHCFNTGPQQITLSQGFYTGVQLATELQTQLDANTAHAAAGITFTVAYNSGTGLFTITPSKSTIRYLNVANQVISIRDSIAGHLFGLEATTDFAANIVSDTAVPGLGTEAAFVDLTASVVLEHYHDDLHRLSIDQALHIESSVAAINVGYTVLYEELA